MARSEHGPIGSCIYCGSKTYAPDNNRPLGNEHVIPEAVSGKLVLLEASCRQCERKINPWETRLLKGALLGCKTYLGLETKRPSERPKELPLFDPRPERRVGAKERKVMVGIKDYPISLLLAKFDAPRLFNPLPFDVPMDGGWLHIFTDLKWQILREKYDLVEFGTSSLDTVALCRSLAKIAHSYAVLDRGSDTFIPVLPHFIMGNYDALRLYYVGGLLADEPATEELHQISIEQPNAEQWRYIVVRIRLFAKYGGPTYRVVAGRRINPIKPLSVLLAEANASHTSNKTIHDHLLPPPIPEGLWDSNAPSSPAPLGPNETRWIRALIQPSPSST